VSPVRPRTAALALLVPVLAFQSWHGARDPLSRYAYVETTPDVLVIRARLQELALVEPKLAVLVLTSDNPWPLPWYLRRFPHTGWARTVPQSGRPPDVILVSTALDLTLARWLYETQPPGERELYVRVSESPLQLRRGALTWPGAAAPSRR